MSELHDAFIKELEKPRSSGIIQAVARDTQSEIVEVVAAMWQLVEEGVIEYTSDSRLYIR